MEKKQVVKRGGNREDFSPAKIRKTIERAAAGFELDLQPLEEKMADFAKDGVSTAEIAKYLTLSALSLTTVTDPDWKNAAGRLKLFELYKQMSETRQTGKNYNNLYDYPQFLKFAEENGIYSKRISEVYSEEEIKLAAGFIRGADAQGVGTSLKHFAANSQELSRFTSDSVMDGRTLRELYLTAFEIAVREGKPSTVMCAYRQVCRCRGGAAVHCCAAGGAAPPGTRVERFPESAPAAGGKRNGAVHPHPP